MLHGAKIADLGAVPPDNRRYVGWNTDKYYGAKASQDACDGGEEENLKVQYTFWCTRMIGTHTLSDWLKSIAFVSRLNVVGNPSAHPSKRVVPLIPVAHGSSLGNARDRSI